MNQWHITSIAILAIASTLYSNEYPLGLSYDDVLLTPAYFPGTSRQRISTRTRLTNSIYLNIPIVSANMDTVTEASMAISMANLGGIGIIHRFNTIDQQVHEVKKVKRYRNTIIDQPITIRQEATIDEAQTIMRMHDITSLLVVDEHTKLVGILTSRDLRFNPDPTKRVSLLMTPRERLVVSSPDITMEKARELLLKHNIEKLPLVHEDWSIAGLITGKDIYKKMIHQHAAVDKNNRLLVGAAIGVKDDALERAKALLEAGADVLVVDIAHGDSYQATEIIKLVKQQFPQAQIIAGNVATAEGTRHLIEAGADAIKVGVGPGSICTTRIVTGCGFPQLSAVIACTQEADKYNIPVIADGGIKYSGDITKAIAAGASTVMLGSLLAGTEESPGLPFLKNGKKFKVIRGMASFGANLGRQSKGDAGSNATNFVSEGVEAVVPYKGEVEEIVQQLMGGFRSGLSYCGVTELQDARGKCNFIRITQAGIRESHSHDVTEAIK